MKLLPRKAIFFDRDGIVNRRLVGEYVRSVEEFEFLPGIFPVMAYIRERGFLAIVISNQQGVGKGLMSHEDLAHITEYMQAGIQEKLGFAFDDVYYCTDLADSGSSRRKPQPGMLLEAIEKWYIDPAQSWMIGDSISDAVAGKRAGCQTILVGEYQDIAEADTIVHDMEECLLSLQNYLP